MLIAGERATEQRLPDQSVPPKPKLPKPELPTLKLPKSTACQLTMWSLCFGVMLLVALSPVRNSGRGVPCKWYYFCRAHSIRAPCKEPSGLSCNLSHWVENFMLCRSPPIERALSIDQTLAMKVKSGGALQDAP